MRNTLLYAFLPVALFLLSAQAASAQSFAPAVNYPSAAGAQAIAVGDFNVDGKPDLAVANQDANNVKILLGNGDGTFVTLAANYPVGSFPFSIVAGDFNRDGKPDLVVGNYGGSNVSVLINNSGSGFNAAQSYTVGFNPISVVVGDFNSDGKLDVATSNQGANKVGVLIGNGNGTFVTPAPTYTVGSNPISVVIGDLNGDGKLDLATANNSDNTISVLIGNGNGTFITPAPVYSLAASPINLTARDFNGDGKPDLATANYFDNTVSVLLNNGSGGFGSPQNYAVGTNPSFVTVGDFNVDGKPDLAASNSGSNSVSVLIGNGNGTFVTPAPTFTAASIPNSVTVGDLNRDGRDDLITANYSSNDVSVLINNATVEGAGFFGTPIANSGGSLPQEVALADFNLDGKLDFATASIGSNNVSVRLGNGNATFQPVVNNAVTQPESIVAADLNGDGKPDLATANFNSTVSVLIGNGNGTFVAAVNYTMTNFLLSITVGDFNGDGKLDLATAEQDSNKVDVLLQNPASPGVFLAPATYTVNKPRGITTGDFNGDGKLDLATANGDFATGDTISVLLQNAATPGTFNAAVYYGAGEFPDNLTAGDLNGDGKLDLAVANNVDQSVSVLLQNPATPGTFNPAVTYHTGNGADGVAIADLNLDGRLDLAVANFFDNSVSVLMQNPATPGAFNPAVNYTVNQATSVAIGDFNTDGRPDLAVTSQNGNNVSELINRASAPTSAPSSINGQVNTPDGAPLPGAVVTLSGAHSALTITDSLGKFHFDNLDLGGFYILTPRFASYSFAPENRAYSLAGNVTDATFTATPDAVPTANPLDTSEYFVRQQYIDFLEREPDAGGFAYWSSQFELCGNDASCLRQTRINVSAAFFIEAEFQQTGSFIYRLYKAGLGRRLNYAEFNRDRAQIIGGAQLDRQRAAFVNAFVERADFQQRYADALTAETFVERLIASVWDASAVDLGAERSILLAQYHAGANVNESRAIVLHSVVEDGQLKRAEYDKSFVLMQYYGYLRRDVDEGGYQFWLNVLDNREPNNYRGMVCAFITSAEYQKRFSSIVTHSNAECGQ